MATRRPLVLINGGISEIPVGDVIPGDTYTSGGGGGGSFSPSLLEANLGGYARRGGTFTATVAGPLTPGNPVQIWQASLPATGKGLIGDESEMDAVTATGIVLDTTTIRIRWASPTRVVGLRKFYFQAA